MDGNLPSQQERNAIYHSGPGRVSQRYFRTYVFFKGEAGS